MALRSVRYGGHTFAIGYEIVNPERSGTILFLHGWGAERGLMRQAFGNCLKGYRHLYIDLPGFGKSSAPVALDTADYAEIVKRFLALIGESDVCMVVGHSFGGKVALLLDPERLVLLGSAGIPVPKPLKVRLKIALFKGLKRLGLAKLRSLFVADDARGLSETMYETFKRVVDEDFTASFAAYGGKALLCWGRADRATPLHTARTMEKLIEDARLVEYEGDHYFFVSQAEAVGRAIEAFMKEN